MEGWGLLVFIKKGSRNAVFGKLFFREKPFFRVGGGGVRILKINEKVVITLLRREK